MKEYSRRRYRRVSDAVRDMRAVARRRGSVRALMRGKTLDPRFRERLMLAVTEVNGCRYCSYAHARSALAAGLTEAEIAALARGELDGAPPEQAVALVYARHWAEADGAPDPAARRRVVAAYGETATRDIELTLQMIRVGNLLGNTWDYLLFRASSGRRGDRSAGRRGGSDRGDGAQRRQIAPPAESSR
jgi:AhpD family alkylhydroperoxidase